MSEMVERVARALSAAYFREQMHHRDGTVSEYGFRELALSAIRSMREPTAGMLERVSRDGYSAEHGDVEHWQAMIDEALK